MDYKLTKAQLEFLTCKDKEAAAVSGLGGGKSFVLMLSFIVNEVIDFPDALHCFVALSNQQLRDVSMPMFESFCEDIGLKFELNKQSQTYIINGKTRVMFRSLDVADRMRSVEIGSLYIEEYSFGKKYDIEVFRGRLRDSKGSLRERTAFTPNGFNHAYDYWVLGGRTIVRMSTFDNKHLPPEYIKALQDSYDSQLQKQELEGEFINLNSGSIYHMFSRLLHVKEFEKKTPTHFGMDFNVNPLTGASMFMEGGVIYVQDEMYLNNSNTFKAVEWMKENLPSSCLIVPDSTGNARKTSSSKTDHQIIKEGGFQVADQRNPSVKDRFNCVNNLLDKGKLVIHPDCKKLIEDLEKYCHDNKDPNLSHISDATGYAIWNLAPMKAQKKKNRHIQL
jgi:PBSX family phage terminase large subunit